MKLSGKKALITGGNSGIGLATARLFIQEGAEVAITGRDQATLDQAAQELGPKAVAYRADVTDPKARQELFAKLGARFGRLDIIFANAGISGRLEGANTDQAVFEKIITTNLTAAYFTVAAALPILNEGGSVIFNGSVQGSLGPADIAAYAASKAGVRGLARTLASDLAPRNIRVNVVSPGATRTSIWSRGGRTPAQVDAIEKKYSSAIPLGRFGEPEEIAKAVLFLASDDASYIDSVELFVDGGAVGSPSGAPVFRS